MNVEQDRADFESFLSTLGLHLGNHERKIMFIAYQAGRASLQAQHEEEAKNLRDALWVAQRKLAALQSQDREDAERFRKIMAMTRDERMRALTLAEDKHVVEVIDHARRVEGGGE